LCLLCGSPGAPHGGMNFVEQTYSQHFLSVSAAAEKKAGAGRSQGAQLKNTAPPKMPSPPIDGGCAAPLETFKVLYQTAFAAAAKPK
jgi:hypothetical protein